jgi:hypothetical protein
MSQRDLVAELRAARVEAPSEVRDRVQLIVASAPAPPRRVTWRRALVVAVPMAAAVAATVVLTRPAPRHEAEQQLQPVQRAATHGEAAAPKALAVPSSATRVQVVGETLSLRVRDVSDSVKQAVRIATSLGGFASSVHASTNGKNGTADLTLKVPRADLAKAVTRLSALGTITSEHVDVSDRTAQLNATDRLIARLQKQLTLLRAQNAPAAQIAALTQRIELLQRQEAATRRRAHYATLEVHLATTLVVHEQTHHGPLHGVGVALTWLGVGAVYALAIGGPVVVLLLLLWLAARFVRRRRVDALLSRS